MLMIKHIADEVLVFLSVVVGLMMISCLMGTNILASATVPQDEGILKQINFLEQSPQNLGS